MDTLSHAAWGYAALSRRGRRLAAWGALAGAAPDLLYFVPSKIEQIARRGWAALTLGREPGIWRATGPPMPPELLEAYSRYYVYTHSLLLLALATLALLALGRRRWAWLAVPYALHILMDIPTHERYLTQPFFPLSSWSMRGVAWIDPRIFWPNLAALVITFAWIWRRDRAARAARGAPDRAVPAADETSGAAAPSRLARRTSPDRPPAGTRLLLVVALGASLVGSVERPSAGDAHEAPAPLVYDLRLPDPGEHWMEVTLTVPAPGAAPLDLRMSRASPGRYALHEFAKNVFGVTAQDGQGRPLEVVRTAPNRWRIGGHDGTVRVTYRVFGDRLDGTYLAIDRTHAHVNMPAAILWVRGLEEQPMRVRLEPPRGVRWHVATQLYPTADPWVFEAPNLQYLMDSPLEASPFLWRTFTVPDDGGGRRPQFRIALHHDGGEAEADAFARDVDTLVRETRAVFGEFPEYEPGTYTFLADYLPHAAHDGMEHRNSTVLTAPAALRRAADRPWLLGSVAHEFFHSWNVERIRPRSLEPFNFEEMNVSGELWFAEGVTSYYDTLVMQRAGLATLDETARAFGSWIDTVVNSPGRRVGSVVDMSRLAPLVDGAATVDRTNWENTYISYYTWGAAIGLALDLALREKSGGRVGLDDYLRALWVQFGKPGGRAPGLVDRPYTAEDLERVLGQVAGETVFADEFFARYVEGREVADYARLLAQAGLVVRRRAPGRVADEAARVARPGDGMHETGANQAEAARLEVVPVERAGGTLTEAQRHFRQAWLGSKVPRPTVAARALLRSPTSRGAHLPGGGTRGAQLPTTW